MPIRLLETFIDYIQSDIPTSPNNGEFWWDGYKLVQYDESKSAWVVYNDNFTVSDSYGVSYVMGGHELPISSSSALSTITKITFSTMSLSDISNTLSKEKLQSPAFSSTSVGYSVGGIDGSLSTVYTTGDKILFSDESVSDAGDALANPRHSSGTYNSSLYGYVIGDESASLSSIEKLNFSTSVFTVVANTHKVTSNMASFSSTLRGFMVGDLTYQTAMESQLFSTDTSVILQTYVQVPKNVGGISSSLYGYVIAAPAHDTGYSAFRVDLSTYINSIIYTQNSIKHGLRGGNTRSSLKGYTIGGYYENNSTVVSTISETHFAADFAGVMNTYALTGERLWISNSVIDSVKYGI